MESRKSEVSGPLRANRLGLAAVVALGLLMGSTVMTAAQDGPPGLTTPTVFAAFDPNAPACAAPPGLERVPGGVRAQVPTHSALVGEGPGSKQHAPTKPCK